MNIRVIGKEDLKDYKHLMLSYIYEELADYPGDLDEEYICLSAFAENADGILFPVSVVICQMEPIGDLNVLSIYTLPDFRRKGYASELLEKVVFVGRQLFIFDDDEDDEDIYLKTIYRLAPERESVYESFLKKNHFTEFVLLDDDGEYKVWSALAEINFYRRPGEGRPGASESVGPGEDQ